MKKLSALLIVLFNMVVAHTQQLIPVDEASSVTFSIKNFGINANGSLKGLKGSITFSRVNPSVSLFNVNVDAATISTGIAARDNHLKKEEYFNVQQYPLISFTSTKVIDKGDKKNYAVQGRLMIKGISKEISFPFVVSEQANGFLF